MKILELREKDTSLIVNLSHVIVATVKTTKDNSSTVDITMSSGQEVTLTGEGASAFVKMVHNVKDKSVIDTPQ